MKRSTDNLRHTRWEYKYHVVFIPKYRKKSIYGWVRKELGPIIRDLAQQKERSGGGASDGRPCAHAVVDTTEVLGVRGGGVYQGQECNRDSSEFHWIERRTLWGRTFGRGDITCTEICLARYLFNLLPPNPQPDKLERLR
jgi:REP-associated tyrosine transposase